MTAQVDERLAVHIAGQSEALAKAAQRVERIAGPGGLQGRFPAHDAGVINRYSNGRLGTASPPSAGTCSSRR